MRRLFFALRPDAETRAALAAAAQEIDVYDGRRVRPENLHLTLVFLGAVPPPTYARLLSSAAPDMLAPFELSIALAGWWRKSAVSWLAPLEEPPSLLRLQAALAAHARALGCALEDRPFRPHITIARACRRAPRAMDAITVVWQVTDFTLMESRSDDAGARYQVRRRWPLNTCS
ncbi:MAG: RNA 2',3'-cyclic phosphodiesterase [Gammaproteobacteria bacterium]